MKKTISDLILPPITGKRMCKLYIQAQLSDLTLSCRLRRRRIPAIGLWPRFRLQLLYFLRIYASFDR